MQRRHYRDAGQRRVARTVLKSWDFGPGKKEKREPRINSSASETLTGSPEGMTRRQRALLIRSMIFLFVLNSLSLALYFFLHSPAPHPETPTPLLTTFSLKPRPSLPSFLPWNPSRKPPRSCEAYFGNGFSRRIDAYGDGAMGAGGWFRCFYSATLKSSVCEGGRLRMDPSKIRISDGGESLEAVMGRREEEELPKFESGSFDIEGDVSEGSSGDGRVVDEEFLDRYVPQGGYSFIQRVD